MSLKLHRYLRRIQYGGPLSPTAQTLRMLHRHHALAIPFENIDVQLGLVPSLEEDAIFEKLVVRERGGWCFEMNLLFAWALRQVGIQAELIGASINRSKPVEGAQIDHLALFVRFGEETYLADVGLGTGFLTPPILAEGPFTDGRFEFKLTNHGKYWRFYNHRDNGASYDFTGEPLDAQAMAIANRSLATRAESPFVQTLACARLTDDGAKTLTNASMRIMAAGEVREERALSTASFARLLGEHFGIAMESDALWARVAEQHQQWLKRKLRGF